MFSVGGRKGKGCGFFACHNPIPRELDPLCGCGMNSAGLMLVLSVHLAAQVWVRRARFSGVEDMGNLDLVA